jgi:hypothetical protein
MSKSKNTIEGDQEKNNKKGTRGGRPEKRKKE